ncbi:MAG: Crp/Fnr family transcriptional regulator [Chitinophagaceae bacterium]|nr:Crp/Fnr family transcriptional regulator [Chitinophagaceae bacterium]
MPQVSSLQLQIFRKNLEPFVVFSDEEWILFCNRLHLRRIKKKMKFAAHGKICNEVGFILNGSFRFFFVKDGIEISNYFSFQNEFISSYRSFLKREPSLINIEAMEDSQIIYFSYTSLQELLKDERVVLKMERFGRMIAEYLICCYEERVVSFVTQTPEERYRLLLESGDDLLQRIPQYYLANYLGITPVSLSRIRKRIFAAMKRQKMAS